MFPRAILMFSALLCCGAVSAKAMEVRYFAAWSYTENAPRDEISEDRLAEHRLGHWVLEFDAEGLVMGGYYRAADGTTWMSLLYREEEGRVYADLYGPSGQFLTRKSTPLADRRPHWPEGD